MAVIYDIREFCTAVKPAALRMLLDRGAQVAAYMDHLCALPGVKAWIDAALAEQDFRDFEEPYRLSAAR